jgi:hypothetical protein
MCGRPPEVAIRRAAVDSVRETIREAFHYAFPVYEFMRTRWQDVENPQNPARVAPNALFHWRRLADHTMRDLTTPNNDTLYSSAWLDLASGPLRVRVPDTGGRYYSVAFMDLFTNNFAYLGRRVTGTQAGEFVLLGPDGRGSLPAGARVIRAPTNDVWMFVRILVEGPGDVAAVHALQDSVTVDALAPAAPRSASIAPKPNDPENFLAIVNHGLGRNPVPVYERGLLDRLSAVGLRPGDGDAWSKLSDTVRARWSEAFPVLVAQLPAVTAPSRRLHAGWIESFPHIGNFGSDYLYRAQVALTGLAALEPAEVIYSAALTASDGTRFDGRSHYRVRIPPGGVPVDAFWSLSMYEVTPDGRRFFADNPLRRYAIGDRTRGLRQNPDGSIDIWIQQASPGPDKESNWLPAPAGPFMLSLRAYQPRPEFRDGRFRLPAIERLP